MHNVSLNSNSTHSGDDSFHVKIRAGMTLARTLHDVRIPRVSCLQLSVVLNDNESRPAKLVRPHYSLLLADAAAVISVVM